MPDVQGRVEALNALKEMSGGDWIAVLDCDDIWEEDKLITQMIAVDMSVIPMDIIGTFCTYFGEYTSEGPALPSGWIPHEQVMKSNPIIHSSVLMRRDVAVWMDRFGIEDYDLWIRSSKADKKMFNIPHNLVRHRIHAASAFNGKGRQDLNGLRSFHGPTVVTAYYPIKSKNTIQEYIHWIAQFWLNMSCNLVFYTDTSLVDIFRTMFQDRAQTRIVGISLLDLKAFQKLSPVVWHQTHKLDRERGHTPELYALWYEKKEFVLRTIASNPFESREFVWCDAGIGRYPEWNKHLKSFPMSTMIPCGRMLVLEIDPFMNGYTIDKYGIPGQFDKDATVGGGILASDAVGWRRWSMAYDAMLMRYYLAGRFIGKDQNIMASIIVENPDIAVIIPRPPVLGPVQGWFYLLFFLSGIHFV